MNLSEVKKLIRLFENSKIAELEIEQEGMRVLMKKSAPLAGGMIPVQPDIQPAAPPVKPAEPAPSGPPHSEAGGHIIPAPMVGTFFRSPSPTSPPFIEEGDLVRRGQSLCVIEAMKLMNEIECDIEGRVTKIYKENGKPVEFGEPLFEIDPS